jgi:hypothetical protein
MTMRRGRIIGEGRTGLDEGKESGIEKAGFYYLIGDSHPDVCVFKSGLPNWGLASHRFPDRNTLEIELLLFCSQFTLGSSAPYNPPSPHLAVLCCQNLLTPYLLIGCSVWQPLHVAPSPSLARQLPSSPVLSEFNITTPIQGCQPHLFTYEAA